MICTINFFLPELIFKDDIPLLLESKNKFYTGLDGIFLPTPLLEAALLPIF
jgi:hypothetical protein